MTYLNLVKSLLGFLDLSLLDLSCIKQILRRLLQRNLFQRLQIRLFDALKLVDFFGDGPGGNHALAELQVGNSFAAHEGIQIVDETHGRVLQNLSCFGVGFNEHNLKDAFDSGQSKCYSGLLTAVSLVLVWPPSWKSPRRSV